MDNTNTNIDQLSGSGPITAETGDQAYLQTDDQANVDFGSVADIASTCTYVSKVVANLNKNLGIVPTDIKKHIFSLNRELRTILASEEEIEDRDLSERLPLQRGKHESKSDNNSSDSTPNSVYKTRAVKRKSLHKRAAKTVKITKPSKPRARHVRICSNSSEGDTVETQESMQSGPSPPNICVPPVQQENLHSGVLTLDNLAEILGRLDSRVVPRPEPFDDTSGQSFSEFLKVFEDYCTYNFRGSPTLWAGELGRFLTGEMHKAFTFLKIPGDSYDIVKQKLLQWRSDSREVYHATRHSKFNQATLETGESVRLFATRLEKAFRIAYPSRSIDFAGKVFRCSP